MKEPILEIQNLCFSYDQRGTVLDHVNLSVFRGERIAVLGSNGAGKSTCFLNMNGVLTPDSGKIIYKGKEIKKKALQELRKNVGIVFQESDNQIIASTVFAEVSFGPMNLKLSKEDVRKRVEEALTCLNLTDMRDRAPHYLSGGEKKRVGIADIVAMKPDVIIFDEPTASLDPLNVQMLEIVLEELNAMGKTLLISTHDVDFAYKWAQRVVVFSQGRIIADGLPLTVLRNDEILKKANLKKPMMMEVCESLEKYGIMRNGGVYPRDMAEFEGMLSEYRK